MDMDTSNSSIPENKKGTSPVTSSTPAITKLKKMRKEFVVNSPSDQLLSPCTRKLEKCRGMETASVGCERKILTLTKSAVDVDMEKNETTETEESKKKE